MNKQFVIKGGNFESSHFLLVSEDGVWIGCNTTDEANSIGRSRWGDGHFEIRECVLADSESVGLALTAL